MSAFFGVRTGSGETAAMGSRGCFGQLAHLDAMLRFDARVEQRKDINENGITAIHYKPAFRSKVPPFARMYWSWLVETPLFKAAIVDHNLSDESVHADDVFVDVSIEVNPHHMLNTLSAVRAPYKMVGNILAWANLVEAGINPDHAFALCWFMQSSGTGAVLMADDWSSEHSLLVPTRVGEDEFNLLIENLSKESLRCRVRGHNNAYSLIGSYRRDGNAPVSRWIVGNKSAEAGGWEVLFKDLPEGVITKCEPELLDLTSGTVHVPTSAPSLYFIDLHEEDNVRAIKDLINKIVA